MHDWRRSAVIHANRYRGVRVPDAVQRVQTMFRPTGTGRVSQEPSVADAGPGHRHGRHPDRRR